MRSDKSKTKENIIQLYHTTKLRHYVVLPKFGESVDRHINTLIQSFNTTCDLNIPPNCTKNDHPQHTHKEPRSIFITVRLRYNPGLVTILSSSIYKPVSRYLLVYGFKY